MVELVVGCWLLVVGWYCLPDSRPLLIYNPETSSRVTLALLGIVFQTKLVATETHLYNSHLYQLQLCIIYTNAHFCY